MECGNLTEIEETNEIELIKGHGRESSKIFFIGDYPSKVELSKKYALTGFSEDIIDEQLRKNKSSIKECYRTLYIKEPLEGYGFNNKRDKLLLDRLSPRLEYYQKLILEEIKDIQPNVIVPLGELALNFIADEKRIDKFRGSVLPLSSNAALQLNDKELYKKIKVIPTWHPRSLVQKPERKPIAALDFTKIIKFKDDDGSIKNKYRIWVCRSCNDFNVFLSRNLSPKFGVFDIETHHGFITCIGFCFDGEEAISIPLLDEKIPILDRVYLFQRIVRLLRQSNINWVNQNILYDVTVEERYGLYVKNIVGDTMLAAHTLYVEMLKGLDFLTSIYTDIPYYKDEGKEFDPKNHTKDQLYLYNAKDCLATWQVWEEQLKEFDEHLVTKAFFFDLNSLEHWKNSSSGSIQRSDGTNVDVPQGVMPLFHVYRKMNKRGVRIDEEKRKNLKIKYNDVLNNYILDISSTVGREINIRSPKQVQNLIYEELQCPKMWKVNKETGIKSLDSGREALEEICFNKLGDSLDDQSKISLLKKIIYGRKVYKIIKYLDIPIHPDGRIRTNFKLTGTKSGRTAGSSTIDKWLAIDAQRKVNSIPDSKKQGLGTSFQTIPKHGFVDDEAEDGIDVIKLGKDIMEIFVPSTDYVFFDGDKSQAEARIVAVLAEDYEILEAFNLPDSYIHRLTASWIYKCTPDEIKKKSVEYEMGKRSRHGGNYGMQAFRFARMCHISFREAEVILSRFHVNQPKITGVFHSDVRNAATRQRILVNPYGRRRNIFAKPTESNMKDFISWIPQGTCSDGTKFSLLRIDAACKEDEINAHCVMEVHDNLIFEVHKDSVGRFSEVYKREMEKPIDFRHVGTFIRDCELVIPVEMAIGTENLNDMKEYRV
jgi:uracil-DNA glycosylase family 4